MTAAEVAPAPNDPLLTLTAPLAEVPAPSVGAPPTSLSSPAEGAIVEACGTVGDGVDSVAAVIEEPMDPAATACVGANDGIVVGDHVGDDVGADVGTGVAPETDGQVKSTLNTPLLA